MPSLAASSAAATTLSIESRSTPGMEATGTRLLRALDDEHRPDQVADAEAVLGDERGATTACAACGAGARPGKARVQRRSAGSSRAGLDVRLRFQVWRWAARLHALASARGRPHSPEGCPLARAGAAVRRIRVSRRFFCISVRPCRRGNGCGGPRSPPARAWCRRCGRRRREPRAGTAPAGPAAAPRSRVRRPRSRDLHLANLALRAPAALGPPSWAAISSFATALAPGSVTVILSTPLERVRLAPPAPACRGVEATATGARLLVIRLGRPSGSSVRPSVGVGERLRSPSRPRPSRRRSARRCRAWSCPSRRARSRSCPLLGDEAADVEGVGEGVLAEAVGVRGPTEVRQA